MSIIVHHSLKGGKLKSSDLKDLLNASYNNDIENVNDFHKDKSLSSKTSKVFVNNKTGQVVVAHRGTSGFTDWFNNAVYGIAGTTGYKLTPRYKEAEKVQRKAHKKYGHENVTTIGHSQGGLQAELLGGKGKEIITVNKATRPFESTKQKNQYDIASSKDIVSSLNPFSGNKFEKVIEAKTSNPLTEHSSDILERLGDETVGYGLSKIQSVLFKKPEWTKRRAVNWLKKHNFKGLDVDEKPEHLRYRQLDPQEMENNNYHFITKPLHKNIEFIIGYQNNSMPRKQKLEDFESDTDSDTSSDTSSECSEDERDIKRKMKDITRHIRRHQIKGGKLNIAKSFKKLGSTIKKGLQPVTNYVTAKKGGLASDLLHEGVPIVTGALAGAAGEYFGGPMGGIVAGELGSRAGEAGANALGKKIGVGLKRRGRPPKASGSGDLIHIDISSHNAKGKKAMNKMEGGFLVNEHPVSHRGLDTTMAVPSFSQTLATQKLLSSNALLNELTAKDLLTVKHILGSDTKNPEEPANKLSPAQRKKIADKMKAEFKKNMAKIKEEEAEKHKPKRSHHKKGSEEAK